MTYPTLHEHRRLELLRLLRDAADYTGHEAWLSSELTRLAFGCARDTLRADLAWLDEQGLIIAQQPGGVWLATLTQRGADAASGLARVPGVARPGPES